MLQTINVHSFCQALECVQLFCVASCQIVLLCLLQVHFTKKYEPKKQMVNLDDYLKKLRMHWLELVLYMRLENQFFLFVEEIPSLLPSSMPGNAVYYTEADHSSVYLEATSKPSGAYMYTLNLSFMSDWSMLLNVSFLRPDNTYILVVLCARCVIIRPVFRIRVSTSGNLKSI